MLDIGPAFEELALAVLLAAAEEATFDDEAAAFAELALAVLLAAAEEATFDDEAAALAELALAVLLAAAEDATFDDEAAALAELAFEGTLDEVGGAIDELTLAALDATEAATFEELLGLAGPALEEGFALDEAGATEAEAILDELATAGGVELG